MNLTPIHTRHILNNEKHYILYSFNIRKEVKKMSRNTSTILEEPISVREAYSALRDTYAGKTAPRVSGDQLAREINKYLSGIEISPREYRVPGAE